MSRLYKSKDEVSSRRGNEKESIKSARERRQRKLWQGYMQH